MTPYGKYEFTKSEKIRTLAELDNDLHGLHQPVATVACLTYVFVLARNSGFAVAAHNTVMRMSPGIATSLEVDDISIQKRLMVFLVTSPFVGPDLRLFYSRRVAYPLNQVLAHLTLINLNTCYEGSTK